MQYSADDSNGYGMKNGKSHFDNLEKRFISIENSIDKITSDINIIQSDIKELKRFRWIFTGFIFAGFAIGIAIILIIVSLQSQKLYEASERQIDEVATKLEIWKTELNDIFKD
ncbi:MAG: hypothetical protein LBU12_05890 [Deltaproteobacteria bacterium]|jgi:hypothetical protein|nr:hypothetical protein [Deltaproteobacteria bacterium]